MSGDVIWSSEMHGWTQEQREAELKLAISQLTLDMLVIGDDWAALPIGEPFSLVLLQGRLP